jgi:hypothetical protein
MCYGDIAHGRDGYYEAWARNEDRKAEEKLQYEEAQTNAQQSYGASS